MLLMSLIGAGIKAGSGIYKNVHAKEEANKIPMAEVPDTAYTALGVADNLSKARSAGAAEAERSIKEAGATADYRAERGTTSGQQLQAAVSSHQGAVDKSTRALQTREEQDKESRMGVFENALWKMASLEQQVEDTNKTNKYNTEQGIKAAGNQEIASGVNQATSSIMLSMMNKNNNTTKTTDSTKTTDTTGGDLMDNPVNTNSVGGDATIDEINSFGGLADESKKQLWIQSGSTLSYEEWLKLNGQFLNQA